MDKFDTLLLEAWNRISAKVRGDRVSALKRSRRRFKGVLTRPMREWCLVIRASDTRINDYRAIVEAAPEADFSRNPIESHQPHTVTLEGRLIRDLTRPVKIPWPGVTYQDAADLCGRDVGTMRAWARQGMFRIDYYREFRFPEGTTRSKPRKELGDAGRGGRPYVWTQSPIDPNAWTGRTPHVIFGTLWQWLWENLPEEYTLTVRRAPRTQVCHGKSAFNGWKFVCPGRIAADGTARGCGRLCTHLFAPQTVWTLARALGEELVGDGFDMPDDSGLAGQWHPGMADTVAQPGTRSCACRKCWRVRNTCLSDHSGWNEFVTHISGGLLYGHDVPRPMDICPMERKKRPRKARRRQRKTNEAAAAAPAIAIAARA